MQFFLTLAAGEQRKLDVAGDYFFVDNSDGEISIAPDGAEALICPSATGRRRVDGGQFEYLYIVNLSGAVNILQLDVETTRQWERVDRRSKIELPSPLPVQESSTSVVTAVQVVQERLLEKDSLAGSSASVTSASAVLLMAAGTAGKARDVDIRAVGGSIYIADDAAVGASNGKLIQTGEVCSLQGYIGAIYAIAVAGTVTAYYDYSYRA